MTKTREKNRENKKKSENFKNFPTADEGEKSPGPPARKRTISGRVYRKRTAFLCAAFLVVTAGSLWTESACFSEFYPKMTLAAASVFLLTEIIYIPALYYLNGRCGILAEYGIGASLRTGIPLFSALVIFLIFDNILPRCSVITLAVFYLFLTPFEVWMTLPENSLLLTLKVSSENTTGRKREEGRIR